MTILEALRKTVEEVRTWAEGKFVKKASIDSAMSSTSENPVQNKVITTELNNKISTITARTINGHALSANITLTADDVGALPDTTSIPDSLSDLSSDSTHRTVTDAEKSTWNAKSNFSGNYNDLTNKPTIPSISGLATETYVNNATTQVKNDLLNGAGGAYDTLKELGDLIDDNKDAIDALEEIAAGKADKTHGTHVTYSTTAPVMDGTASVGSASTVARSDHKHPTDTSRAAQADLTSHTGNTTVHITADERTKWNAAKTHADAAHAPSNAEKNQNAFSNITVGSTTVAADTATDTVTFVGTNVTITPDTTNDKITFAVADGTTSAKGVVKLTNSTSSTSTTTAATPNSVKSAYDLANQAKTAIDAATADDFGIYVQATAPTSAVAGDIWIDTANDPAFIVPNLPAVTAADNGKMLMVVNGKWQAVDLNLSIDANGVVSI